MNIFEAIENRRSIRRFQNKKVPHELIKKLISAATWAPSAHNKQPWEFIVVRDQKKINQMAENSRFAKFLTTVPQVIVVCANFKESVKRKVNVENALVYFCLQDTAAAIQNMLLAAHSLGLAACWIGDFKEDNLVPMLNIPTGYNPVAIIAVGYPEHDVSFRAPARRSIEEVTHYEFFGNKVNNEL